MSGARGSSLIFVTGPPRSGTTLVQNMLDSHPRIVGAPEFRHIHHLVGVRNRLHDDIDQDSTDALSTKAWIDARFGGLSEVFLFPFADHFGRLRKREDSGERPLRCAARGEPENPYSASWSSPPRSVECGRSEPVRAGVE